ncbi:MAG: metal-dependent transcriptional regulator [Planctomycetia bacterium]
MRPSARRHRPRPRPRSPPRPASRRPACLHRRLSRRTNRGREQADTVVRSHRLWEAWLGRHAELPLDHLHPPAEWIEHHLGAEVRRRIEAEVGLRASDPHGRSIPPEP